jgi:flagellar M-ring protein FliF
MAITTPILALKTLLSRLSPGEKAVSVGLAGLMITAVLGAVYFKDRLHSDSGPQVSSHTVNVAPDENQRALEAELARSVMSLAQVEAARVHLVLQDPPKATVVVKLKNDGALADGVVQGIVNVVASSVSGLSADRVMLIDYHGNVLERSESQGTLTGQQLSERQRMENDLAGKIVQILEPIAGKGKVRPQVSVNLNVQQVEETTEQYDPQSTAIRSEQKQEEHMPPNSADHSVVKQSDTINYEVNKAVRHTVEPVVKINSVSVAVIVDNRTRLITDAEGKSQTTTAARTPEEMQKYREIAGAAIGFNPDRGDRLTVENISFEGDVDLVKEPGFFERQSPNLLSLLSFLAISIAIILVYLLFLRPAAPASASSEFSRIQKPMTVKQLEAQLASAAVTKERIKTEKEILALTGQSKFEAIRERVIEQANQDPENIARMVRVWLNERNK